MGLGTSAYLAPAADAAAPAAAAAAAAAAPVALPAATAKPGAMAHAAASTLGEVVSDSLDSPPELRHGRVVRPEELGPIS